MSDRVLILKSETLERELAGILKDLYFVGQAVDIDVVDSAQSSEDYRVDILRQANATDGIEEYHRVVLFVDPPVSSRVGHESNLELRPNDLELLTHLTEPNWMKRMILIQKDNADASDLWRIMCQRGSSNKPKHVFGRPHGRDYDGKYVRQIAQAILERKYNNGWWQTLGWTARLPKWFKKEFAKLVVSAILTFAWPAIAGLIALFSYLLSFIR